MRVFGLIGFPLGHSFSQKYFSEKFEHEKINDTLFENFELPTIAEFPQLLKKQPDLTGLSVTIPYKEQVIQFLDVLHEDAERIGAVNCIKIRSGKKFGYNTDHVGFLRSIIPLLKPHHQKALILGTGGASKAVQFGLTKIGLGYRFVSRTKSESNLTYEEIDEAILNDFKIIINTTPLGTFPHTETYPDLPYDKLSSAHLLYDLVYNPGETLFLQKGKERGTEVKNGYEMLLLQAEEAWRIWNSI